MKANDNVYPIPVAQAYGDGYLAVGGLTNRDHIAIEAMKSWIIAISARHLEAGYTDSSAIGEVIYRSYETADAMLAKSEKPEESP